MGLAAEGTLAAAIERAAARLGVAGVDNPGGDARMLLAHAMKVVPTWIFAHALDPLAEDHAESFEHLVGLREKRVPLQHLLGEQEFWKLRIEVGPQVLVPRPETEHLVEAAIAAARGIEIPRVADIGTGSGCIAVALASELASGRILAIDASPEALVVARRNAAELGFDDRIEFHEGDLVEPLRELEPVHAIAANLPYVSEAEWEECEPEVRDHDPRGALVGGPDGLELVERLIAAAPAVLAPGGWLGLEVGWKQARRTAALLEAAGWRDVEVQEDFAGIERIVAGRRSGS
jgi:release factor glutamine methyltransferase